MSRWKTAAFLIAALAHGGCTDSAKVSEKNAVAHVERLAKLADDDVEELRRGMPRGAKALGPLLWDGKSDPHADPSAVRHSLDRVRNEDRDLEISKGTFFAVADDKGTILRSDQEPDQLAGKSIVAAYGGLAKALAGDPIELRGFMSETAGARTGGDEQWVIAAPVRDGQSVKGVYVSGWSLRRFAYHLEETLKHDLAGVAMRAGETRTKLPLLYVFVFAGSKVYGAPVTPLVNSQALEALDLVGKTADDAAFHQTLELTGRGYGLAAKRAPKMGPDVGVAVLRSEI